MSKCTEPIFYRGDFPYPLNPVGRQYPTSTIEVGDVGKHQQRRPGLSPSDPSSCGTDAVTRTVRDYWWQ